MATVTGKTSEKIDQLLNPLLVSVSLNNEGQLTLTTNGGASVNAGSVSSHLVEAVLTSANKLIFTRRNGQKIDLGQVGSKPIDAWPVGSIFMGVSPANPATQLGGGTWVAWGSGRMPVGVDSTQSEFDAVEEVGGTKTVTLTEQNLPPHSHDMTHTHGSTTTSSDTHSHTFSSGTQDGSAASARRSASTQGGSITTSSNTHSHTVQVPTHAGQTGVAGQGTATNNLPPYITCYMWKRTA